MQRPQSDGYRAQIRDDSIRIPLALIGVVVASCAAGGTLLSECTSRAPCPAQSEVSGVGTSRYRAPSLTSLGDTFCPPAVHSLSLVEKTIIAEAASEGYQGMYAVGCVIRNRNWSLQGFAGASRKDLDDFIQRQPRSTLESAVRIVSQLRNGSQDATGGATHFENVDAFGVPWWAKEMSVTKKVGAHTFYKER